MQFKLFGKDSSIDHNLINEQVVQKIADAILNSYILMVDGKEYRVAEIEFYIKTDFQENGHVDSYTHGDPNQKRFAKWYFHRYPNGSYKGGTYKGLDLTLGNKKTYFGVLIRAIYDEDTGTIVEGPCKVVNKILEHYNCTDVAQYMNDKKDPLNARNTRNFYLKRKKNLAVEDIYCGSRIGLSDRYPEWRDVKYRFLIKKQLIKKKKQNLEKLII
jgi:3-methyladenine DNA glycosylase Mpg